MSIRVAVIEDQSDTRKMLAVLINGSHGYECIATFENGEDALAELPTLNPDVVLVDIHLSYGISGIDCVVRLKQQHPDIQFVMCTAYEDSDTIFKALQAGATGYITKSTSPANIIEAIRDANSGGAPMNSHIARKVTTFFHNTADSKANTELNKLSDREQEILNHLSKGYRYKEIASLLFINIETVRKHIHNIYEKLQVSSRTDAINKVFPKK